MIPATSLMVAGRVRTVTITPSSSTTSSAVNQTDYYTHTVTVSDGAVPTSYSWHANDGGTINGATNGASASLLGDSNVPLLEYGCDVVVEGVTYSPTCTRRHTFLG